MRTEALYVSLNAAPCDLAPKNTSSPDGCRFKVNSGDSTDNGLLQGYNSVDEVINFLSQDSVQGKTV